MKIAFHGAARTVTGSKHLITLKNGRKILLDCGMFQGMGKDTDVMNRDFGFAMFQCCLSFLFDVILFIFGRIMFKLLRTVRTSNSH